MRISDWSSDVCSSDLHVQLSFSSMITPSLRQWFLGYLITFRTEALGTSSGRKPNNSFKPNLLRYTKAMAEKACHGFGSTTQFGLTQRSEERSVGKECVSMCRSRSAPYP